MKDKKLTYSVNVPAGLTEVIKVARQHLATTGYKKAGDIIFISDVFTWGIKLIAKKLGIDISNGLELEFVSASKLIEPPDPYQNETDLCRILSSKDFSILEDYKYNYRDKGIDVFDFCTEKGIDWKKLIRDYREEKAEKAKKKANI